MPVLTEISLSRVVFWRPYFSTTWSTLSLRKKTSRQGDLSPIKHTQWKRLSVLVLAQFHINRWEPSPLYGEVIIALGLGGDVLPQLVGRQAGPRRVVTAAGDPVATLAAFAA